jgi:hypothetical protein
MVGRVVWLTSNLKRPPGLSRAHFVVTVRPSYRIQPHNCHPDIGLFQGGGDIQGSGWHCTKSVDYGLPGGRGGDIILGVTVVWLNTVCPYGYATAGKKIHHVQSGHTPSTVLDGVSF